MAPMTSPSLSLTAKGSTLLLSSLVHALFTVVFHCVLVSVLITCAFCSSSEDHCDGELKDS